MRRSAPLQPPQPLSADRFYRESRLTMNMGSSYPGMTQVDGPAEITIVLFSYRVRADCNRFPGQPASSQALQSLITKKGEIR